MISAKKDLIHRQLEEGTGAAIAVAVTQSGRRSGLKIWFGDYEEKQGPVAELLPHGLRGHRVELRFGSFSGPVIEQIQGAQEDDLKLARALLSSIDPNVVVELPGQNLSDWVVRNGSFRAVATIRHEGGLDEDTAISLTCGEIIVPMMAAMAELIGYDVVGDDEGEVEEPAYEGAVLRSVVTRRERNPRNRLLCIRIHGEKCGACGCDPRLVYGAAGSIIEVHHLEPLASLVAPRPYDPRMDLVPLCPNCHRAAHTRRPLPLTMDEIRAAMGAGSG